MVRVTGFGLKVTVRLELGRGNSGVVVGSDTVDSSGEVSVTASAIVHRSCERGGEAWADRMRRTKVSATKRKSNPNE